MKSITIQRLTPRVQIPEFLKVDREAKLRAEIEAALPAMRAYASKNPKHNFSLDGTEQDPNGVHAWLERNDPPRKQDTHHALP